MAEQSLAETARSVLRTQGRGALSTLLARNGGQDSGSGRTAWPYTSLVTVAIRMGGPAIVPLLLLSELAEHTRNLRAEPRLSLLLEDPGPFEDPLAGPRLTLLGRAAPSADPEDKRLFVERHPSAALYADFADFSVWTIRWERAHLVAGFGRIRWMTQEEIIAGS